ncbi:MAG: M20/M25/M40 family metallo-hydrolase [Acidobacteriota bacterium]|nr:MAG: M20/M25/M40 family metallo-hydrolase [Acidobacteriota bacterium]
MPIDPVPLLAALVRTPSPSGEERPAAGVLASWAREHGLQVELNETAVRIELAAAEAGPTLLLASHLDTVAVGDDWSVDPFSGLVRDERLFGRGAVDAKGSIAAMGAALAELAAQGGVRRGRLVVLGTYREETRAPSMPQALERLSYSPDAAIIGEPTRLEPCIAQRGLIVLRLTWRGEQLHAGWAVDREPRPELAIERAASDLVRLSELRLERRHRVLGQVAITPTMIRAGESRSMTPASAEAFVDVRTVPCYEHAEVIERIRKTLRADVEVISDHRRPVETPAGSRLLSTIERIVPDAAPFGSPTSSDWIWLDGVDAVKWGPGDSRLSHTADESIAVEEVRRAAELYAAVATEYLS